MKAKAADRFVLWKYWVMIWLKVIRLLLTSNPVTTIHLVRRYAWLRLMLFRFNSLYFRLCRGRQGRYLQATALVLDGLASGLIDVVRDVLYRHRNVVLTESIMSPEIFRAMGLTPFMMEFPDLFSSLIDPSALERYIDIGENSGIPPDTCSFVRSEVGVCLEGELPDSLAVITTNSPCDPHIGSYTFLESQIDTPMVRLDVPYQVNSERATEYFVEELKGMISWLEANTPGRMDWDRLRAICDERNRMVELQYELWETLRAKPAPMAGEPIYLPNLFSVMVRPGEPKSTRLFEQTLGLAKQNLKQGIPAVPQETYRVLNWNSPIGHFIDVYNWAERTWGVTLLMESLAFNRIPLIDTETPESILRGLARIIMVGPMARHTRGPAENYLNDLFYIWETFDIDMVWVMANMGCKKTAALQGILRERCRKKDIPLLIIEMDVVDPRTVTHRRIIEQIDDFMENTMGAKRLDGAA